MIRFLFLCVLTIGIVASVRASERDCCDPPVVIENPPTDGTVRSFVTVSGTHSVTPKACTSPKVVVYDSKLKVVDTAYGSYDGGRWEVTFKYIPPDSGYTFQVLLETDTQTVANTSTNVTVK